MSDTVPPTNGPDRVQSTATGELLAKLAKAPKLDEQRFSLEGEVGKGGMGAVLKIHDRFLNRRLAMKVLLERPAPRDDEERRLGSQLLGRFLEEAQVTSQLDHPGVVPVHELGLDANGKVWFTMRLVKGRTASEVFADALAETNDWTLTRALEVVLKVCDTMAYAHDKGVLHRDLKPGNVMVGRFGEVYVMDWGLAKVQGQADRHDLRIKKDPGTGVSKIESTRLRDAERDDGSSVVSMDGQQLGTPSYMSPEQARSEDVDARTDVYAIGAMLYELLTGRAPYETPGLREPAYRILKEVVDGPPKRIEVIRKGVPAELVAIVEKAMARDREDRFANVTELASDLRAFLAQRTVKAYRTGALIEMRLWMRRNQALAISIAAAALILVGATLVTSTALAKVAAENEKNALFAEIATLAEARRIALELYPPFPDMVPAMESWIREFGDPLGSRLLTWEQKLRELEQSAKPFTEAERAAARESHARLPELRQREAALQQATSARRRHELRLEIKNIQNEIGAAGVEFADPKNSFVHRTLALLVFELGDLVHSIAPSVATRLAEARSVHEATVTNCRDAWQEAMEAIAASDDVRASRLYKGFRLMPQTGLVPIGMNEVSKLWEFVHTPSGTPFKELPTLEATTGQRTLKPDSGIVFVLIPGGTLPPGTKDHGSEASCRLGVMVDPFFLGKYELTNSQWVRLLDDQKRREWIRHNREFRQADPLEPACSITWFEAEEALRHAGLVLPTELQWEYACRGNSNTTWWTGDNEASLIERENVGPNGRVRRVGSMRPNPFGLYDIEGNVWEWCLDPSQQYGRERAGDGARTLTADSFTSCTRGGSANSPPAHAGSGFRADFPPSGRSPYLGLRAARAVRP